MKDIKTMCEKYYVYGCYVDGKLKYVGMGSRDRYKHCISGKSSCSELNRDFHEGKTLYVDFFQKNMNRVDAMHLENKLILENLEALYNKKVDFQLQTPNIKKSSLKYKDTDFNKVREKISDMANTITEDNLNTVYEILMMAGLDFYLVESGKSSTMLVIDKFDENMADKAWYEAAGKYADGDEIPGWRD